MPKNVHFVNVTLAFFSLLRTNFSLRPLLTLFSHSAISETLSLFEMRKGRRVGISASTPMSAKASKHSRNVGYTRNSSSLLPWYSPIASPECLIFQERLKRLWCLKKGSKLVTVLLRQGCSQWMWKGAMRFLGFFMHFPLAPVPTPS